ncbi:hypothetical protein FOA52_010856 [Chlamydomonas sp. UWO 241]|nr:hypothetical protein FOA52_010856 [Chlamydomonas sp. UWO 241]
MGCHKSKPICEAAAPPPPVDAGAPATAGAQGSSACSASLHSSVPHATGSLTQQRPPDHVSRQAVNLDWLLNTFLAQHPEVAAKKMSTQQVIDTIIKPATAARNCRYADLVGAPVSDGRPFYFVSHTWSRQFAETVGQLERRFRPEAQHVWRRGQPLIPLGDVFVWFDIFAINQHAFEGDLGRLQEVVSDAEQTLMILDQAGAVLTRIWCLYEAFHSGRKGPGCLALLSYGIDFAPLKQVFIDLDVASAQATGKADLDRIQADIEAGVGARAMTHILKDALVDGMLHQVPPATGRAGDADECGAIANAARMCHFSGRYDEAEPLARRVLAAHENVLGAGHPDTLNSVGILAGLLEDQGKLDEAEPLARRALAGNENVLGAGHPDTLTSISSLARLLYAQGKLDEAEPLARRAVAGCEKVLGNEHPASLSSVTILASVLEAQGKLGEVEELFRRALAGRKQVLGAEHPDTLISENNLAMLLQDQGSHLAALLKTQGDLGEAEALARQELAGCEKVLGAEHPDTLTSVDSLAMLLKDQGKLDEAEPLYMRVQAGREKVLGAEHPDTRASVNKLFLLQMAKMYHVGSVIVSASDFTARGRGHGK